MQTDSLETGACSHWGLAFKGWVGLKIEEVDGWFHVAIRFHANAPLRKAERDIMVVNHGLIPSSAQFLRPRPP